MPLISHIMLYDIYDTGLLSTPSFMPYLQSFPALSTPHTLANLHIWEAHQHQVSTPPLISIICWQVTNYDSIILYRHDVMASQGLQIYWRVNILASLMDCYSYSLTLQYGVAGYLWYFSAVATPWFIFISTIKKEKRVICFFLHRSLRCPPHPEPWVTPAKSFLRS